MIISKPNPVGKDAKIAEIQKAIDKAFNVAWAITGESDGIICYPRCYINFKKRNKETIYGLKVIEHFDATTLDDTAEYIDANVDYKDVLDGEENRMIILSSYDTFQVNNLPNFESTLIECIFIVNLNKTHPTIKHRADEEVRIQVKKVLEKIPDVRIHRTVTTLNRVFGDIRYSTMLDIHPLHCFKVILSLERFKSESRSC